MVRKRVLAITGAILVATAACSAPAATGAPTGQATTPPTATQVATQAPASAAPTQAAATQVAIDVATVLPETVGGQALETTVLTGAQLDGVFFGGLKAVARNLDVDLTEMNVVVGRAGGTEILTVVQVPGKDTAALEEATKFGVSLISISGAIEGTSETVGGKAVKAFSGTFGDLPITTYIYVVGDTMFVFAGSASRAIVEELLAGLP